MDGLDMGAFRSILTGAGIGLAAGGSLGAVVSMSELRLARPNPKVPAPGKFEKIVKEAASKGAKGAALVASYTALRTLLERYRYGPDSFLASGVAGALTYAIPAMAIKSKRDMFVGYYGGLFGLPRGSPQAHAVTAFMLSLSGSIVLGGSDRLLHAAGFKW